MKANLTVSIDVDVLRKARKKLGRGEMSKFIEEKLESV